MNEQDWGLIEVLVDMTEKENELARIKKERAHLKRMGKYLSSMPWPTELTLKAVREDAMKRIRTDLLLLKLRANTLK